MNEKEAAAPAARSALTPEQAAALSAILRGLIELWATHSGKPEGWIPTEADINDLLALNDKTPEDFYREAALRLGVVWPAPEPEQPES